MSFCPMVEAPPAKDKPVKVAIPHVITQFSHDGYGIKEKGVKEKKKKSNDTARTKHYAPSEVSLVSTTLSTLSGQATPKSKRWNFEFRHRRHPSTETNVTPQSAIDTVFDTEIYELPASPNSSTKSSSGAFAVELEDTSQTALHSKRPAYPGQQLDTTSRYVIKRLEQNIAAIEAENQQLLSRAVGAEETVRVLTQHNQHLRQQIEHCENNHRRRPRAIASQPSLRQQRNKQSQTAPQMPNDDAQNLSPAPNTTQYPTRTSSHHIPESESPKSVSPTALAIHPFPAGRHLPNKPLPSPPARPPHPSSPSLPPPRSPTYIQGQIQHSPTHSHNQGQHTPTYTQHQIQHSPTHIQNQAPQYLPSTPPQVQVQPQQHQSSPTKSSPQSSPRRHSRRVSLFPAINSNNRPLMPESRHGKQGPMRNPSIDGGRNDINIRSDINGRNDAQVARQNPNGRSDFQQPRNIVQARNDFHVRSDAQARNDMHGSATTPGGMGGMGLRINAEQIRDLEVDLAANERTFISGLFQEEEVEVVKRDKRWI